MGIDYHEFLNRKSQLKQADGFEPVYMPDWLFPFQRHLVEWAVRKGRSAIFADCGLGKTPMQLVWAENVVRKTNKPVLILTPLAVSHQTYREAEKFGIDAHVNRDGKPDGTRISIANYEKLHHFDWRDFGGVVCDESSIIKNFNGKIKSAITEFMRLIPYRLLCTATAAPNDYIELGTSSEALGYLGYTDMVTMFFKEEIAKDFLGWGRKTYRFRGHAAEPFWRWVCSWARAIRKPSDLGFDDDGFVLPKLIEREERIQSSTPREGYLISVPAKDLQEQREERRVSMAERCNAVADLVTRCDGPSVVWCHLNPEGDMLEKVIPDAVQVSGSISDEKKEERLLAFQTGEIKRLITKPKIGCFGLNWQHCRNVATFPSHSWEQYYQLVRRCYRFGQTHPVTVTTVTTEGEEAVLHNLRRKADNASEMFSSLVRYMGEAMHVDNGWRFDKETKAPSWLR